MNFLKVVLYNILQSIHKIDFLSLQDKCLLKQKTNAYRIIFQILYNIIKVATVISSFEFQDLKIRLTICRSEQIFHPHILWIINHYKLGNIRGCELVPPLPHIHTYQLRLIVRCRKLIRWKTILSNHRSRIYCLKTIRCFLW